jgi:hypothetical protein
MKLTDDNPREARPRKLPVGVGRRRGNPKDWCDPEPTRRRTTLGTPGHCPATRLISSAAGSGKGFHALGDDRRSWSTRGSRFRSGPWLWIWSELAGRKKFLPDGLAGCAWAVCAPSALLLAGRQGAVMPAAGSRYPRRTRLPAAVAAVCVGGSRQRWPACYQPGRPSTRRDGGISIRDPLAISTVGRLSAHLRIAARIGHLPQRCPISCTILRDEPKILASNFKILASNITKWRGWPAKGRLSGGAPGWPRRSRAGPAFT